MECSAQVLSELYQIRIVLQVSLGVLSSLLGFGIIRAFLGK